MIILLSKNRNIRNGFSPRQMQTQHQTITRSLYVAVVATENIITLGFLSSCFHMVMTENINIM